jgi:hypothetical protein
MKNVVAPLFELQQQQQQEARAKSYKTFWQCERNFGRTNNRNFFNTIPQSLML